MEHESSPPAAPPAATPSRILGALPRLQRMDLAGREDRLLLRLARRMGYTSVASVELIAGTRGAVPRVRAVRRLSPERVEADLLGAPGACRHLQRLESPRVAELRSLESNDPIRPLMLRTGMERCTLLPLGAAGVEARVLLLGDGPSFSQEDVEAFAVAAHVVVRVAVDQTARLALTAESAAHRRQSMAATQEVVQLRAEAYRLRRLDRLSERLEPVTAGARELTRVAAETLSTALDGHVLALVRPARREMWVACPRGNEGGDLEALLRDALARTRSGSVERFTWRFADADLAPISADRIRGHAVLASAAAEGGERLVWISLSRTGYDKVERDFFEAVAARTLRALDEREMVARLLERARFLERRLDQVAASHRIARALAAPMADAKAPTQIVRDVRQSFRCDAAVLLLQTPNGGLTAVCEVDGDDHDRDTFIAWAHDQYRRRLDPEASRQILVRETGKYPAVLTFEGIDEDDPWRSRLQAPFSTAGGTPGLLCLAARTSDRFGAEDRAALHMLAGETAHTLGRLYSLALRERTLLGRLVRHMATGILLFGPSGEILAFNPAGRELLGLPDGFEPETLQELEEECGLALGRLDEEARRARGDLLGREVVLDGVERRHLQVDVTRVGDGSREQLGTLLSLHDVSRQKELEQEQREFISTVSHELKTPLTSMKTAVTLLLKRQAGPLVEDQERFLGMTMRNIDRLSRLIEELLDVARQEAGRLVLQREVESLSAMVRDRLEELARGAEESERFLSFELEEAAVVYADGDRVLQIVDNLVSNALKFTERGGHVIVNVNRGDHAVSGAARRLAGMLDVPTDGATLVVEDDGCGMDEETQRRAFHRFFQAGDPLESKPHGTGLGLSITQALVSAHQGAIEIDSALDRGTRLRVWLPASAEFARLAEGVDVLDRGIDRLRRCLGSAEVALVRAPEDSPEILAALREFLTAPQDEERRFALVDDRYALLLVPDGDDPTRLLVEALSEVLDPEAAEKKWALGVARFPEDGHDLGTLLARAGERMASLPAIYTGAPVPVHP